FPFRIELSISQPAQEPLLAHQSSRQVGKGLIERNNPGCDGCSGDLFLHSDCPLKGKRPDTRASEGRQVRSASQLVSHIGGQLPDICALGTADLNHRLRPSEVLQRNRVNTYLALGPLNLDPLTAEFIKPAPFNSDGRK